MTKKKQRHNLCKNFLRCRQWVSAAGWCRKCIQQTK